MVIVTINLLFSSTDTTPKYIYLNYIICSLVFLNFKIYMNKLCVSFFLHLKLKFQNSSMLLHLAVVYYFLLDYIPLCENIKQLLSKL